MGSRGPVPKRSEERRRTNSPEAVKVDAVAAPVAAPEPDEDWHPVARRWFESLAVSAQARFYEPSDWGVAFALAEGLSRELKPRPKVTPTGAVVEVTEPPSGAFWGAFLRGCAELLVTEGSRRRVQVEVHKAVVEGEGVTSLDEHRRRLAGGS